MNAIMNNQADDPGAEFTGQDPGAQPEDGESQPAAAPAGNKRSSMAMLVLLLAGLGAMGMMYLRNGPEKADASLTARTQAADAMIHGFLSSNDANHATLERSLKNTEKIVQQFLNYPSARQVPLKQLGSNPFRVASVEATDAGSEVAMHRREQEQAELLKEAQALRLQSVIHSDTARACLIDNTLYHEGQVVAGFIIERIKSDGVVVKSGTYRFELRMQR